MREHKVTCGTHLGGLKHIPPQEVYLLLGLCGAGNQKPMWKH